MNQFSDESKTKLLEGCKKSAQIQKDRKNNRISEYEQNPIYCLCCMNALSYKQKAYKFCSRGCSKRYHNQQRPPKSRKVAATRVCQNCDKPTYNKTFCSQACGGEFKRKDSYNRLINAQKIGPQAARSAILDNRKYQCEKCLRSEWNDQKIPLVMDHIDGNSENNHIDNLQLLCCNCDAQTPTYKSKNRGKGRFKRLMRYHEGKSY